MKSTLNPGRPYPGPTNAGLHNPTGPVPASLIQIPLKFTPG
jgi:hypothetical protein